MPVLGAIFLIVLYRLVVAVQQSVTNNNVAFVGLANYGFALRNPLLYQSMRARRRRETRKHFRLESRAWSALSHRTPRWHCMHELLARTELLVAYTAEAKEIVTT